MAAATPRAWRPGSLMPYENGARPNLPWPPSCLRRFAFSHRHRGRCVQEVKRACSKLAKSNAKAIGSNAASQGDEVLKAGPPPVESVGNHLPSLASNPGLFFKTADRILSVVGYMLTGGMYGSQ